MLLLNATEVRSLLPMKDAIDADKKAFLLHSSGETEVPIRPAFTIEDKGTALVMPAYVKGNINRIGIKIVSVMPGNAQKGLPVVPAQVLLLDTDTGEVCAMMNGAELTKIRTGAISGAATDILARKDAAVAALFGTGGQAPSQMEALLCVRNIKEVRIFDANKERIEFFINQFEQLANNYGAHLIAAKSPKDAVENADVITTVTTSNEPVFNGGDLKEGAHINGVGSFTPNARELDTLTLTRSKVFVDNLEAVLAEAGDLLIPIGSGEYSAKNIIGELGDVLAGKILGRESANEITLVKTVGYAVLDVVSAYQVYQNAIARGMGTHIDI